MTWTDHPEIWLEPECEKCAGTNPEPRLWCQHENTLNPCEECGLLPIKYRHADTQLSPEQPGDYPDE